MDKAKSRHGRSTGLNRLPRGKHDGVQLLLIHSVDHLGRQGDVHDSRARAVKFGDAEEFARFLGFQIFNWALQSCIVGL